jgi:phosphatidate cytidylyltransferase
MALAIPMALAAAAIAFEIGTMYAASGLRVSRGAGALLAALLVARWSFEPAHQPWADLAIGVLAAYTLLRQLWHPRMYGRFTSWGLAVASAVYAGGLLGFLVLLRDQPDGFLWVALALAVTWAYDTFGYLVGRSLGRHGFMTHISPRKTWEGVGGGMLAAIVVVVAFAPALGYAWWLAIPLGFLWGLAAQTGDLVASMLKRDTGQKDSGRLIPGHGGMLDRLDALLFVAPAVFAFATLTS